MSQTVTVTDAKARLSELVAMVERTQEHVDITRNGEPAAVLLSHAELEAMQETIAVLSDARLVEDIRQGEADIAAGNTVSAQELRDAMQARRFASGLNKSWTVELTGPARRALQHDLPETVAWAAYTVITERLPTNRIGSVAS